jgi:5-methylcytosine-specific restriction protein A
MKFYNQVINIDAHLWCSILQDHSITNDAITAILMLPYGSRGFESSGGAIASALGYSHHAPLNRIGPDFSKRILKKYDHIKPPLRADGRIRYWHVPFLGTEGNGKFSWILRHELAEAVSG